MNVRRRHGIQKGLKDYMVPIIGLLLIIILIFSVFSGDGDEPNTIDLENKVGLTLNMDSSSTESYIEYPGSKKEKVSGNMSLYKGEKVMVKEGTVSLALPTGGDLKLNRLGELKYLENGDFSLFSSDLWLNTTIGMSVDMRFATVKVGDNTHISFAQNEMGSTVYLISGFAEVENLAGQKTVLASGQKITITRLDANKDDIDLSLAKENLDDYFKQSDWFILNNGSSFLQRNGQDEEETGTGTISSLPSGNNLINILNLSDGSNVSSNTIVINGNFTSTEITKITLNGEEAKIDSEAKTFKFENVSVSEIENDLVFKVYDDANDMLERFVYTVYNDGASANNTGTSKFNVQTFDVDGSQFKFTTIKDGVSKQLNGKTTYTTYGDFLTIYGEVTAKGIADVAVNGYTLQSFNGSTWRYHPSILNNNLSVGTNVYEVKYYNEAGTVVYTNHFTIIKKKIEDTTEKVEEKETQKVSDEASIN